MSDVPKTSGQMQVIGEVPPQKQRYVFGILTILVFVIGVLLIVWDGGSTSSGPMAVSDGCCFGSLFMLCSLAMVPFVLIEITRNNKHPVVMYVQK
jgi:drug/metabolite transporter (DMT)-like permease